MVILSCATIVLFLMTFVFFVAQILKDNSIVDIAWGLGFVFVAVFTLVGFSDLQYRQILITLLILIWGLRLSLHILLRKRGQGEDYRYRSWRKEWGKYFPVKSYFNIFVLQGILILVISLPVVLVNTTLSGQDTWLDAAGLVIWSLGFVFEFLSDWQLSSFKKDPHNKGKIMDKGLWKWSRHPNYFGEITMWWGIFIIALSSPYGIFSLISPLLITNLIIFYSGIPLLEKKYKDNEEFKSYAKKTPILLPRISR